MVAAAAVLFTAGIGVGYSAKVKPVASMYQGQDSKQAAQALLGVALQQAGKGGSWERIGVGRVYYLGGFKEQGQKIFDDLLYGDYDQSDAYRIARVYREAGEWEKAKPIFDRYLAANPGEEKDLAEVGSYYLLNGDRATAEKLFDRSYAIENEEVWSSIRIAGAYLGVTPQH